MFLFVECEADVGITCRGVQLVVCADGLQTGTADYTIHVDIA